GIETAQQAAAADERLDQSGQVGRHYLTHPIGARTMERAIPILPADDLLVAKQFYVDRLGFDVRFEATKDGTTGLLGVDRGTISLTLDSPMSGHGRAACDAL